MAIYRLLKNCQLSPMEINRIATADDHALRILCVKDRDDLTETVAKKIIKIAQTGVHDPTDISALAVKELELR